jgi:hypothetical protein
MIPCMTNDHTFLMKIRVIGSDHAATGIRNEFQDDVEDYVTFRVRVWCCFPLQCKCPVSLSIGQCLFKAAMRS